MRASAIPLDEKIVSPQSKQLINIEEAGVLFTNIPGFSTSALEPQLQKFLRALIAVSGQAQFQDLRPCLDKTILSLSDYIWAVLRTPFREKSYFEGLIKKIKDDDALPGLRRTVLQLLDSKKLALSKQKRQLLLDLFNELYRLFEAAKSCGVLLDELGVMIKELRNSNDNSWNEKTIDAAERLHAEMYAAHRLGRLTQEERIFLRATVRCVGRLIDVENRVDPNPTGRKELEDLASNIPSAKYPNLRRVVGALLFFAGLVLSIFVPPVFAFAGGLVLLGSSATLFGSANNRLPVDALRQFNVEVQAEKKTTASASFRLPSQ